MAATAPDYNFYVREEAISNLATYPEQANAAPTQQVLFATDVPNPRIIPFDSLTANAARRSSRTIGTEMGKDSNGSEISRPAPLTAEKVQVRRPRNLKPSQSNQRHLELFGNEEVLSQPEPTFICDTPVAPVMLRVRAGLIDTLLMVAGCVVAAAIFRLCVGADFVFDKRTISFLAGALITIPLFYRFLWAFAGMDSVGMRLSGLRLVDFDGNPPSQERRYHRILGSLLSVLAAGMGLIWSFVDQYHLSWHDHISSTFPVVISEE
jgi:uncharacterized RDD family membrane protein YckC